MGWAGNIVNEDLWPSYSATGVVSKECHLVFLRVRGCVMSPSPRERLLLREYSPRRGGSRGDACPMSFSVLFYEIDTRSGSRRLAGLYSTALTIFCCSRYFAFLLFHLNSIWPSQLPSYLDTYCICSRFRGWRTLSDVKWTTRSDECRTVTEGINKKARNV